MMAALVSGCAGAVDQPETTDESLSGWSSPYLYFYVSPTPPDHEGGPLALRRANAVPGGLNGGTYGYPVLPYLSADDAKTQAALDSVLAVPYAGHENEVIALFAAKDDSSNPQQPASKVYEVYLPSQPVHNGDVQQHYSLFQRGGKLMLVNEGQFPSGTTTFDESHTVDANAARSAVDGGAYFFATGSVSCSHFLWWMTCKTPSSLTVGAYFSRID